MKPNQSLLKPCIMFIRKALRYYPGILSIGLVVLLFDLPALTGPTPPILDSPSYLLADNDTGKIIYGRRIHEIRAPASTTKIMTVLLALELSDLNSVVTVSPHAQAQKGSKLGISAGEKIPLRDLLCATMIRSGNDGATAIAEHVAGSVSNFCVLMNKRAKELGMKDTYFANPHGMPDDKHYSTAFDLAIVARQAMLYPEFRRWVSMKEVHFDKFGNRTNIKFESTNHFLDKYPFANGIKTGYTNLAGFCLVASATYKDKTLICVVLGCKRGEQWPQAIALFDYGFSLYDPDFRQFKELCEHGGIF